MKEPAILQVNVILKTCGKEDSEYTARKWRETLNFEQVSKIQRICGSVIQKLGYDLIKSEEQLANFNFTVVQNVTL